MARIVNRRSSLSLTMIAAVTLSGCVVRGGGGGNHVVNTPAPVPTYAGCPALQGSGAAGLISLNALRGRYASLESYIAPDYYVRHYGDGPGVASRVFSRLDQDEATFHVVPGLADTRCISFEASNLAGHYLRHREGEVGLDPASSDLAFAEDATFCPRPGLADPNELSFETCDTPDGYLNVDKFDKRSDTFGLYVDVEYGAAFDQDATFLLDER